MMKKSFSISFWILGSLLFILSVLPTILYGVFNVGVWLPAIAGILLIALPNGAKWAQKKFPHGYKKIKWSILVLLFCCIGVFVTLLSMMIHYSQLQPDTSAKTVIVLGCEVKQTEPSQMLSYRIDAAYEYLVSHPQTVCIAAGGLGNHAQITEAECIKKELIQKGISADRIYTENTSANTDENMGNAAQIIQKHGLGSNVVVVTDAFHEYRASLYAQKYGLNATPFSAYCPYFLQQSYWVRDMLGLVKYAVIDNRD